MKDRVLHSKFAALWAALLVLNGSGTGAGNEPMERATLKGLHGLQIVVDRLPAGIESSGLDAKSLRARIEERVQKAGVTVTPDAGAFLGIHMRAVQEKKGAIALCMDLGLFQTVSLQRDQAVKTVTETWGTQSVVLVWPKQVSEAVTGTVDELVDQFVDAYRSANK